MCARIAAVVALLAVCLPQHVDAQWRVSRSTNPLDDSTTVVAILDAEQGTGGLFRNEPVRLIARCQSNRTEAYVVWHDFRYWITLKFQTYSRSMNTSNQL